MKKQRREVESEERRYNCTKVSRKKIHRREMLGKSRNAVFFQWFVGGLGRKVTSVKRRVRRPLLRADKKNCTPLWRETHFQVKMYKTPQTRTTFWSCDVEKLHAAVARSTFQSQNVKKLTGSDHFLKLRCRKIARRCSEKHIFKSKCTKHCMFGPLFEVAMSKNCTPLWREAHLQVKMSKNWGARTTFWRCDVEKLHAVVARGTFASENVKKLRGTDHFLKLWGRKIARRCSEKRICKWKCTKHLRFAQLLEVTLCKWTNYITN